MEDALDEIRKALKLLHCAYDRLKCQQEVIENAAKRLSEITEGYKV